MLQEPFGECRGRSVPVTRGTSLLIKFWGEDTLLDFHHFFPCGSDVSLPFRRPRMRDFVFVAVISSCVASLELEPLLEALCEGAHLDQDVWRASGSRGSFISLEIPAGSVWFLGKRHFFPLVASVPGVWNPHHLLPDSNLSIFRDPQGIRVSPQVRLILLNSSLIPLVCFC